MSTVDDPPLPIDAALPELTAALRAHNAAVLVAPPGAGKTTRVPLVLAGEDWAKARRILVLEPRRLAARAAAERVGKKAGERAGGTVGPRAPRRSGWRRRWANASAIRSACGCGLAPKFQRSPASKSSPRESSPGSC